MRNPGQVGVGVGVGARRGGRPLALRGHSFTQATPQGKSCVMHAEEMEKTSKMWFKCSDFVLSQTRVHFFKKTAPRDLSLRENPYFTHVTTAHTEHSLSTAVCPVTG